MRAALYFLTSTVLGFAVLRILWPGPKKWERPDWLRLSAAPIVGLGLASCLYFALRIVLGLPANAVVGSFGVAAASAAIWAWLRCEPEANPGAGELPKDPRPAPVWLWVLFGVTAAAAISSFLMLTSMAPHGEWDGWSIWNLRARFLFRGQEFASAFSPRLVWSHPDYPLLAPGAVALGWHAVGGEAQSIPAVFQFLLFASAVSIAMCTIWNQRGASFALIGGCLILGATGMPRMAASLYADVPLSAYCTMSGCFLYLALRGEFPQRNLLLLSGLGAGLAAWTKNEGILFSLALLGAAVLPAVWERSHRKSLGSILWLLPGAGFGLAIVGHFRYHLAPANDLVNATTLASYPARLFDTARLADTLAGMSYAMLTFGGFLIPFFVVAAIWLALVRFRRPDIAASTVLILVCLQIAGYFLFYVAAANSLEWHVTGSAERILLHVWPLAVVGLLSISGDIENESTSLKTQPNAAGPRLKK